jgi:hypothetical protein
MMIPKHISVGRSRYTVDVVKTPGKHRFGFIDYEQQRIVVGTHSQLTQRRRSPQQQSHTFWHEMTHAILRDMGHRLEHNEEFVDAFAKRLNDAIHSAEL